MADSIERLSRALEGRYRVQREIGEGGMATVYLADDLKHQRQVALKVLKPELTAVVGAERFLAEIKTTANLQHPHVLPLFDSGEAGGFLFYVMPYVQEGETLRDRLEREGQLSVGESVRIATAVAGALDYAHRHGVIHRDVKPANILLQDGEPVVADFGIALAVGAAGGSRLTETGLSLGTPYYMSPEQATGDQTVGPPSDLYSLACVLYEMLVGEPPYVGNSAQAVLGKIISGAVVSPAEQRRSIPPNVDAAIRKGLEKVPADRFASAHAFAEALADPSYRYGEPAGITTAAGRSWKRLALVGWALAAVAVAAHGWSLARPAAPAPVTRVSVFVPEDQRLSGQGVFDLAPDGTFLVYAGVGEADGSLALWVRRWDALSATRIPGTREAVVSRISPDGREVAFFDPLDGAIRIVPLQGGMSRTVVADSLTRIVFDWSPDGEWIYYQAGLTAELRRAPAAGGDGVPVVRLDSATTSNNTWFDILPDGSNAVVEVTYATGPTVQLVDLETGEARHLTPGQFPRYADGRLLFGSPDGSTLMAAPFDPGRGELTGPAVPVAEGVRSPASWNYFSVAGDGTLVYATGTPPSVDHEIVRVDRQGQVAPIDPSFTFDPGANNRGLSLSPDGRRLAVTIFEDGNYDIWIKELPRGPLSRLTFDPAWDVRPRWTPDGRAVTFLSTRDNPGANDAAVWSKLASGTRPEEKVMDHELPIWEAEHSPDMTWLIGRTGGQTTVAGGRDVWAVRPGADTVSRPLVVTGFDEKAIGISPDGRWLLYESDETGRNEIYVRPFPDVEGGKWTVSTGGGVMPRWARSGNEIFYVNASGEMVSARAETDGGFRVVERSVLFPLPRDILFRQGEQYALYDVAPDGDGFVMFRRIEDEEASTELVLVRNWTDALGGG